MNSHGHCKPTLLSLPGELRNRIYEFVAVADLEAFVERMATPSLLHIPGQVRREYSAVFFESNALQIDAYHGIGSEWNAVQKARSKRVVFENSSFTDLLLHFWSLASARRYCQRLYSDCQGHVEVGIMTVITRAGIRRWLWTMNVPD